jgi:hypothetical protein
MPQCQQQQLTRPIRAKIVKQLVLLLQILLNKVAECVAGDKTQLMLLLKILCSKKSDCEDCF